MKHTNLNGSDITFERDNYIKFDEAQHRYSVDGYGEMQSVSSVVAQFFKEFDALYWSLRKCNQNVEKAAQLREQWDSKGCLASQVGTYLHKQIEDYLNGKRDIDMLCEVCYKGNYLNICDQIDITREWTFFKAFHSVVGYTPFRTEWRVYDTDARIAGTIDLVCSCADGSYEIYDWKRSNKIDPTEVNKFANGLNGLEHLTDTSYSHYCLQQNLYRYMLERNYGIRISRMNLVVLHPDYSTYRVVPIPRMDAEVAIILQHIKNS